MKNIILTIIGLAIIEGISLFAFNESVKFVELVILSIIMSNSLDWRGDK